MTTIKDETEVREWLKDHAPEFVIDAFYALLHRDKGQHNSAGRIAKGKCPNDDHTSLTAGRNSMCTVCFDKEGKLTTIEAYQRAAEFLKQTCAHYDPKKEAGIEEER